MPASTVRHAPTRFWLIPLVVVAFVGLEPALRTASAQLADDLLKKVKHGTVHLQVKLANGGTSEGSGWSVDRGMIITNAHVLNMHGGDKRLPSKIEVTIDSGESTSRTVTAKFLGAAYEADLVLQSLELLSLPLPQHTLKPKERIRLQKMLLVGLPEMYVPTHADVKYQYLGVRKVDGRETAFFDLNAELRPRRGDDNQINGRLSGSLDVLLETGEVLLGNGFMNVDYDLPGSKGLRMVGTLSANVRPAPPPAPANKPAEKAAKSGEKGSKSAEGDSKSEEKKSLPSKDNDAKPEVEAAKPER